MSTFSFYQSTSSPAVATAIFLHGLTGNGKTTWMSTKQNDSFWPQWLIDDIEGLQVYTVNYDAKATDWLSRSMPLTDRASNISAQLISFDNLLKAPIFIICHSLGGLIAKQVLRILDANSKHDDRCRSLLKNIQSIIFLGTPHTGSAAAVWANRFKSFIRPSSLTRSLVFNDPGLRDLNEWYRQFARDRISHLVLRETVGRPFLGVIVDATSSDPGLYDVSPTPVDTNHAYVCKPRSRQSEVYILVKSKIVSVINSVKPVPSDTPKYFDSGPKQGAQNPTEKKGLSEQQIEKHIAALSLSKRAAPFIVLLCTPSLNQDSQSRSQALSLRLQQSMSDNDYEVVLGEELGLGGRAAILDNNAILSELEFIRRSCDAVVIIADSIGTWCELGLFSWQVALDKKIRKNDTDLIALVDHQYQNISKFFVHGSFALVNVVGRGYFVDFEKFEVNIIIDRLNTRRLMYRPERRNPKKGQGDGQST